MSRVLLLLLLAAVFIACDAAPLAPIDLRCEYLSNPRGIDMPDPRFSWVSTHTSRAQAQSAYRILVSFNSTVTTGDQWDSGKVASALSAQVAYAGDELISDRTYFWKVMWFDGDGNASPWSQVAMFDTGFLNTSDWGSAAWIAGFNMFRKEFVAPAVVRARAFIAGLGYHELYINGDRIGSNVLDPAWTMYPNDSKYVVHDITKQLKSGNNTVGVLLGNGWWGQGLGYKPQLRLLISMTTAAGVRSTLVSDVSWQGAQSPIVADSIYNGETYNATLEQKDWNKNHFDASTWGAPSLSSNAPPLSAQLLPPIKIGPTLEPRNMTQPEPGTYVFDFGQNFSGWCVLSVKGTRGTTVTMRHAEILYPNGTLNVENLRSALATDTYVLSGSSKGEKYEPRFTYHGFRFVAVTGYPGTPTLKSISAKHIYSSVNTTGTISFNNPTLDRIQQNIWWGQTSNLMSVPTDCDQRDERLGWMADAHLSAEEAIHNFDMSAFYYKWANDMAMVQVSSGAMYDVVPPMRYAGLAADPAWDSAFPLIVSYAINYYNDTRLATALYSQLKLYVAYLASRAQSGGLNNMYGNFGDWVPPPPQQKASTHFTGSWYYLLAINTLENIAQAIGEAQDAETYAKLFSAVVSQFNAAFLQNNTYDLGLQTDILLPLWLGIAPSSSVYPLQVALLNDIITTQQTHLSTGILGTKYLPLVLDQIGRTDVALALALQLTYPSWAYMFTQSDEAEATTLWELWNSPTGSPSMDSRNHIMFGSIGAWFYETLAGIHQLEDSLAFSHVNITPPSASSLASAPLRAVNATLNQLRGLFAVSWQMNGGQQCAKAHAGATLRLSCGDNGGVVKRVLFASFGAHDGDCVAPAYSSCHAPSSLSVIERECLGRSECNVEAADEIFGDTACGGPAKSLFVVAECSASAAYSLNATVPVGVEAIVTVSKNGQSNVTITESSIVVWNGSFVAGDAGISGATEGVDSVIFTVSSGSYSFVASGSSSPTICVDAPAGGMLDLACPPGSRVSQIRFASLGDHNGCKPTVGYGSCHVGASKHAVEKTCLGKESCSVPVTEEIFGKVSCNYSTLAVEATCAW